MDQPLPDRSQELWTSLTRNLPPVRVVKGLAPSMSAWSEPDDALTAAALGAARQTPARTPMDRELWKECDDPRGMFLFVWGFDHKGRPADFPVPGSRKLRLLACNVVRMRFHRDRVDASDDCWGNLVANEQWADGAWADGPPPAALFSFGPFAHHKAVNPADLCWVVTDTRPWNTPDQSRPPFSTNDRVEVAAIVRDMMGDPWSLPKTETVEESCPHCRGAGEVRDQWSADLTRCPACDGLKFIRRPRSPWADPTAVALAHAAYDSRREDGTLDGIAVQILADRVEENGCDEPELLRHLREGDTCLKCGGSGSYHSSVTSDGRFDHPCLGCAGTGRAPHRRGCWAIDLMRLQPPERPRYGLMNPADVPGAAPFG